MKIEPNLVIFDCDGTLVDSQHAIFTAMERAFASRALVVPSRAAVLGVVGLSLVNAVARLLPRQTDAGLIEDLAERYKSAFQDLRKDPAHDEPLFPGCRAALDRLMARDDVLLGIATGKSRRGVDIMLKREGLTGAFSTIQTADDHPSKPHPSMIERALGETGVEAAQAVMVGDTSFDMEMAREAGVAALGVAWGYHPVAELQDAGAHMIIDDFAALEPALATLLMPQGERH